MTYSERLLFGERLRDRRTSLKLTQEYVAEHIGVTTRFYQMIERGEKSVSLDTLINMAKILSISIDYLLLGELSDSLENPVEEMIRDLSPSQRATAGKILTLYAKACKNNDDDDAV